jgi:hypothetical protein
MISTDRKHLQFLTIIVILILSSMNLFATDLIRKDYSIVIPDKCTIGPEDTIFNLDHLTTINFSDTKHLTISVVKDPSFTKEWYEMLKDQPILKMENVHETSSDFLNDFNGKATLQRGLLNGSQYCLESGWFTTNTSGFILIVSYPEIERDSFKVLLKEVLHSFKAK